MEEEVERVEEEEAPTIGSRCAQISFLALTVTSYRYRVSFVLLALS